MDHKAGTYVVINHEEQYSIQPADRAVPSRAKVVHTASSRQEAEAYLKRVWGSSPTGRSKGGA